jgi:hypothetical protein
MTVAFAASSGVHCGAIDRDGEIFFRAVAFAAQSGVHCGFNDVIRGDEGAP